MATRAEPQCWFAIRVSRIRLNYALTIDRQEADVLDAILATCSHSALEMVFASRPSMPDFTPTPLGGSELYVLPLYDFNGDGVVSCEEARRLGVVPVRRGHPAYPYMDDLDGDGVVCD